MALLCHHLPALGYEPVVVCSELHALRPLYQRLDALGVRRIAFDVGRGILGKAHSVAALTRLLASERIDVAHLQLIFTDGGRLALLAAGLARVPVVVTHHAAPRVAPNPIELLLRRPVLKLADEFIAVSRANRADQIRYMALPADHTTSVHNGIAVPPVAPEPRGAGVAAGDHACRPFPGFS